MATIDLILTALVIGLMLCPFTHSKKEKEQAAANWQKWRSATLKMR